jgi:formylmethanofuran dehydrogenase subunit D
MRVTAEGRGQPFILIPGRSTEQGTSVGDKSSAPYRKATCTVRMHPADMERLGVAEGGRVRIRGPQGVIEVSCVSAKDELPPGMIFMAYGPESSKLMGGETEGTGMPESKGIDVDITSCEESPRR